MNTMTATPRRRLLPLALAALSLALPAVLTALNDTDALVREGLFPLHGGGAALHIASERVSVTLDRQGHLSTVRTYALRNAGPPASYRLGALCSQWTRPCREVSIEGVRIRFWSRVGRLAVRGHRVTVQEFSRAAIEECETTADGDVCGHVWAEFPLWLDAGQVRTVTVRYATPLPENHFFQDALDALHIYTERFWAGTTIPEIEFRFAIEGATLREEIFSPLPGTSYDVWRPSAAEHGVIVWRLRDQDVKSDLWLVHPLGIDRCALYKAYRSAGGHYPKWPPDHPVTPCS
jgi:hypothetical protein